MRRCRHGADNRATGKEGFMIVSRTLQRTAALGVLVALLALASVPVTRAAPADRSADHQSAVSVLASRAWRVLLAIVGVSADDKGGGNNARPTIGPDGVGNTPQTGDEGPGISPDG
jgi:hypothetical protein